ncbi:hypothetical protein ACFE04_024142 [Oxalis oulophora]
MKPWFHIIIIRKCDHRDLSLLVIISFCFLIHFCSCQPQNLETFYPGPNPPPYIPFKPRDPPPPWKPLPSLPPQQEKWSNAKKIVTAIAVTALSTLAFAVLFFVVLQRYIVAKRRKTKVGDTTLNPGGGGGPRGAPLQNAQQQQRSVGDNVIDAVYCKKVDSVHGSPRQDEEKQSNYLVQEKGTTSNYTYNDVAQEHDSSIEIVVRNSDESTEKTEQSLPQVVVPVGVPPLSPPQVKKSSPAPPAPILINKGPAPPPPPPPARKGPPPPSLPKRNMAAGSTSGESSSIGDAQVKLKPLHWDKLNPQNNRSMVWDRVNQGSFSYDSDLMEALFGYVATNIKSPGSNDSISPRTSPNTVPPGQIAILDPRRSQNIAIVLKSLAISRSEILGALTEGKGLSADTLDKLMRIAPSKEEEDLIFSFNGDPIRLADAESFHYHILKAVPSAFIRLRAMQFRFHYDAEIYHFKQTLQTLELACDELRKRGLFVKLLEAVLKAGNRMNAGTARGNAHAFNLSSLQKLSDVKSTDGKTTLLHFIVQEVMRSEGKRSVMRKNRSLGRNISLSRKSSFSDSPRSKEERDEEYLKLGIPIIGGLKSEFFNVKKAATVDYDEFISTCSVLTNRTEEIREIILRCDADRKGGFAIEMRGFLEAAENELRVMKDEQTRVMEYIKQTSEYYQTGASKAPATSKLQLFVIVKDFLAMVDQVGGEVSRNMQRRKATGGKAESSSSPKLAEVRTPVRFPNLPERFMKKEKSMKKQESLRSSSSSSSLESDSDS